MGDIVKSRSGYANLPELLRTSPNQGAIDGFPVIVYGNGCYQGRYTLNIPKDKWMNNMDDTLDTHCILCGENYYSGCFLQSAAINGTDWTDELHDVVPATIKTRWNEVITFVKDSTDADFKANLNNYIDVESAIDYLLYGIISTGFDAFGKNQIYMTYDGIKWIASMYDMDSTWGLWWDGSRFVATDYAREQFQDMTKASDCSGEGNKLYVRLQNLFINQIKARYTELRQTIFTYPYLVNKFEEFTQICPNDIVVEDYASATANGGYTGIPSKTTNNIQQLRSYINARLTYVDGYINAMHEAVPCTNITLNKTTLSFTTGDAQTLTATLTPTDTTDTVVWSVNPTGVCTVEDGVVTAIKNGTCVITATCGTQKATCNVTVNLPSVACTSIALNKTALQLGTMQGAAPDTETNLLEGLTWKDGQLNDNTGLLGTGTDKCITNIQIPGTGLYTLSANVRYTYLKMCLFNSNNQLIQTDMSGINSVPTSIYVYEPNYHMSISLFPNSLEFDVNNVTLKYVHDLANTPNKDADFQANVIANPSLLTTSGDYSIFELYADKIYSDVAAIKLGSNIYKLYNTSVTSNNNLGANAADTSITRMKNGYCTKGTWQNKTLFNIAVPSTWGTTKEDIANYIQTNNIAVVMNPSEYLNSADKISSTTINSYQLKPTIQPNNCTDSVEWSTSPTGIVIVNNGLVNAVKNGEAVVTATCGTKSATCNVTVNGIVGSNKLTDFIWSKPNWSNWANQTNYYSFETTITDYVIQNNIDLSTIRLGDLTKETNVNNFQKTPQEGYIISYWNNNIYLSVGISSNKLSDDSVKSFTNYCANNLIMTYDKLVPTVLATPSNYATNISNYTEIGGNLSVANGTVTYEGTHSKNSSYYLKGSSTNSGNLNIMVPSSKLVIMDFKYNLISSTDTTDITIGFMTNNPYMDGQAHISKIGTGTGRIFFMNVTDEETILKDVYVWPGALNSTQSFTIELGDIKYGHIK